MHAIKRDPNLGYLSDNLYVPKKFVNIVGLKNALTLPPSERQLAPTVLWRETAHHLSAPREFWRPEDFQFEVVDCRPRSYTHVDIRSRIVLDKMSPDKTTQQDALSALLECRGGILQLSCGGGKSPIALELAARMKVPTIVIMDTEQLMTQWSESIEQFLELPDTVGRIQAAQLDWQKSIVLATYHTLARRADELAEEIRRWFGLIIFEECFPSGTMVDGRPIETISVGDEIRSFNHETGSVELRRVTRNYKSTPGALVRVALTNGKSYVCTPGHPFFTNHGYTRAEDLHPGDAVATLLHHEDACEMRLVLGGCDCREKVATRQAEAGQADLLLQRARCSSAKCSGIKGDVSYKSKVRVSTHEKEQPYGQGTHPEESIGHAQAHRTQTESTRREWSADADTTKASVGQPTLGARVPNTDERIEKHSEALQGGSCLSTSTASCRSGRWVTLPAQEKSQGCQERSLSTETRVARVEILKQTSDGSFGRMCPGGVVYNLEVEHNHNYFVDDVLVHNCHHLSAPTFSKTADLFYGKRIALSATPERADGLHIVYNFHVGPVVYKNLMQELVPRIIFKWTGLAPDDADLNVRLRTHDSKGELHLGMLAGYFGGWRPRLEFVLSEVRHAVAENRKILVLSSSIAELVNLLALWNGMSQLYSDIPFPAKEEVNAQLEPIELTPVQKKRLSTKLALARKELRNPNLNPLKRQNIENYAEELAEHLARTSVWDKCQALYRKRRRAYLDALLAKGGTAGLMIHAVDAETRTALLRTKQVTFAIAKYGREGLDERSLDTVIVCEPFSDKNTLQQLLGRVLRKKEGKKAPTVVFLEDDVGILIGMCQKLKAHMRNRPADEGGPLTYELHGYPTTKRDREWLDKRAQQSLRTPRT